MPATSNNKFYWMAFNEDYRKGGVYSCLASSELIALIKIQAYCDEFGILAKANNVGYSQVELADMFCLDRITLRKVLNALQDKKIITLQDNGVINMLSFHFNQTERLSQPEKQVSARIAKAKAQAREQAKDSNIEQLVKANHETNKALKCISDKLDNNVIGGENGQ